MSSLKDFLWEYPQNIPAILSSIRRFIRKFRPVTYIVIYLFLFTILYYIGIVRLNLYTKAMGYEQKNANTLVIGVVGQISKIDPITPKDDLQKDLNMLVYNRLVAITPEETITPQLAKSWDTSVDGTTYILHLSQGVHWQNGSPFDASDVIYTLQTYQNAKRLMIPLKTKVSEIDPYTVQFTLPSVDVTFWEEIGSINIIPTPKHNTNQSQSIGTGPYKIESINNDNIVLSANPSYFLGKPHITTLKIITYQSDQDLQAALGRYDISLAIFNDKQESAPYGYTIADYQIPTEYTGIFFNIKADGVQADTNHREAMYKALQDLEQLKSPISSYSWAYEPIQVSGSAQKISGPITLTYLDAPQYTSLADAISKRWVDLGLTVVKNPLSEHDLEVIIQNRNYQALLTTVQIPIDPDQYNFWDSSQVSPSGLNLSDITDQRIDEFLNLARLTVSQSTRKGAYILMQKAIYASYPAVFLSNTHEYVTTFSSVHGLPQSPVSYAQDVFANVQTWSVAE